MAEKILKISRLGAQGDGVAEGDGGAVFVPFALAGETVRALVDGERGQLIEVDAASIDRVAPSCRHFGTCGGCQLQHLAIDKYRDWKRGLVEQALQARGLAIDVLPLFSVGEGARRRATMTARRIGKVVELGFHGAGSHDLVEVGMCPVLAPEIVAILPGLRGLLADLLQPDAGARVYALACNNGLDVDVTGSLGKPSAQGLAKLAKAADALGLARLSLNGDPMYQAGQPMIRCGQAEIVPPPGVFLQASSAAEAEMARIAIGAFGKKARQVADLFCGVGAFSFVLASKAKVVAIDNDSAAIEALQDGIRRTQGVRGIETRMRDLFQEPLSRKELEGFDLVVFDPPRAGARAQAEMIARSKVPTVVAVSCNPATLARDLRILVDGGYRVDSVHPIDQFLYTHHVEVVAVLRR